MRGIAAILSLAAVASTLGVVHMDVDAQTRDEILRLDRGFAQGDSSACNSMGEYPEATRRLLLAQASAGPYTFVFDVYWQSELRPDTFDAWLLQNRAKVEDPRFSTCFRQRYNQWFVQAKKDREICDKHADPDWRAKCNQESTPQYLHFWGTSLIEVLTGKKRWRETDAGGMKILAWQQCAFIQGGCGMLRARLEQALPGYRPAMICP